MITDHTWRERWEEAHRKAQYYRSEKNTSTFWDAQNAGINRDEAFWGFVREKLAAHFTLDGSLSLLDLGCGNGEAATFFSPFMKTVTGIDFSATAIRNAEEMKREHGPHNISFVQSDVFSYAPSNPFDLVVSILVPALYCPDGIDRMLHLAKQGIAWFSSKGNIVSSSTEPIYCGCQMTEYAMRYLEELGYAPVEYPCDRSFEIAGKTVTVPFGLVIARK